MSSEPVQVYQWQYNGVAPFHEIVDWCYKNLSPGFGFAWETIYFADQDQYVWFMLRWS